jgi:A/G-specific adenine glycosylase
LRADWWAVPGTVVHIFTHFRLELIVYRALVPADATLTFWAEPERCQWVARRDLHAAALPSVMRKVIGHALKEN